jgi:hypothetical protein
VNAYIVMILESIPKPREGQLSDRRALTRYTPGICNLYLVLEQILLRFTAIACFTIAHTLNTTAAG